MIRKLLAAMYICAVATPVAFAGGNSGNSPMEARLGGVVGNSTLESRLGQIDLRRIEAFLTQDGKRVTPDQILRFRLKDAYDAPVLSNLESVETWDREQIPVLKVRKLEITEPVSE